MHKILVRGRSLAIYRHGGKLKLKTRLPMALMAIGLIAGLVFSLVNQPAKAANGFQRVAYYGNWDIYGNGYTLKKMYDSGEAGKLTTLVYSFENINPTTLKCFQDIHAVDNSATSEDNPNAGDGGADAWADYQRPFAANESVGGTADSNTQALRGNFNQLKQLKQKFPGLHIVLSVGGWTFSKYFSDAAQPANRAAFVSSCVDMYIRGNLPVGVAGDLTAGGPNAAKGIFDGIDIDWEFPGSANGHYGNHTSPSDKANYTALLAEFRSQLNTQGATDHTYYSLSAALPSGASDIANINVPGIAPYLDTAGIMSYDMHGAWENKPTDKTNFQAPLYPAPGDPDTTDHFTVDESVQRWEDAGMPASKILVGVPFYWRGWSGVAAGTTNGLYQPVSGASSPAFPYSGQTGVAHYKELLAAGKLAYQHSDDTYTHSPWIYDGSNFWTGDTVESLKTKGAYIRSKGLGGAMIYAMESDDSTGSLLTAIGQGMFNGKLPIMHPQPVINQSNRTSASSTKTATNGEPINMIGGNFLLTRHEFAIPNKDNPIDFALNYSSTATDQSGANGTAWINSYAISATPYDNGTVVVQNPDGRLDQYTPNGSGGFTAPQGIFDTLTSSAGTYKVTHKDRSVYNFNTDGQIGSIVSPNGNAVTMHYDTNGALTSVTDSVGRALTMAYNSLGFLTGVTDPSGRVVHYAYNATGDLTQVTNQAGQIIKYDYDTGHHITKITDPRANAVVNNVYDDQGRVTQQTNGLGKTVTLDFTTPGQTTYTDANGGHTIYFYDSSLRLTKVQDALGGTKQISYDAAGNVATTTDELGHITTMNYDARNNLTKITDANGGIQSFTYDANDNLLTRTDQLNRVTTYTYDLKGNITQKKDPLNNLTKFAYSPTGQMTSITDALNNLTGFVYDANGNRVTSTDPSSRNTYYGYDSVGRMTAVETHQLHETDYTLDPMDRLTKATDPLGHITTLQYDADGNKTKLTDANNHATAYAYDVNNNLTKTTNALNQTTSYVYDGNDNLVSKTDAKNHTTTYAYDLLNRQTKTTDPLGNITKVTYDAAGNVATRVDASNRTTSYIYDVLNRLTKTTYPDATIATNTYDAVGNLLTATNSAGTTTYTYNVNNQVLTAKDPHNAIITYTYNAVGSLSTVKYPDTKTATYTYTPSNQLSTVIDWNNQTTSYLYDNDAQLATKTLPNTIKAAYSYDANGNLNNLNYKKGTAAFTNYAYTRDNIGNVTEEDETTSSGTHKYNDYTYDAANQLTMNDAPADTYTYSYDAVGNMATSANGSTGTSAYTHNNGNQLTSKNNTTRTLTYDPQGNEITDTGKTLAYNYDNQLKQLVNGATTTNYIYDAVGNRIDKTQTGTGATNYQFVNAGNNTVLQAKNLTASTNQYYLYGLDQISQGDTASTSRQYPLTDGMGNVRYLTNNSGTTVSSGTFAYDPFGKQTSGSATLSSYLFQGEQKDNESGLVYLRARYYDPTLAKFTSHDPLGGSVSSLAGQNGYNYANDDPVNLMDPTGTSALSDAFMKYTGLQTYQNDIAKGCSLPKTFVAGAQATMNLAIIGGVIIAGGEIVAGGAAIGGGAAAVGGGATATAESASTFFKGAQYSSKVLSQINRANDALHAFPASVDGYAAQYGKVLTQIGNDGKVYQWLKLDGGYAGKDGTFEFIKDANGIINHRFLNVK